MNNMATAMPPRQLMPPKKISFICDFSNREVIAQPRISLVNYFPMPAFFRANTLQDIVFLEFLKDLGHGPCGYSNHSTKFTSSHFGEISKVG